ncbi:predicted protein [Verticillium alfalfae VaMs.102]|uniref:Predicted protein n=1 Tax=Verticillium alfalfae (strain VaMs.102 / ATCC MYA-4576 / FGSC 10136) TaxID=526221 RepID=C9SCE1_VERA1|nr:predicted protein [Verticillium alfalfae VaMs.102]EEY16756.1 predicted protein [Verticillium alfalfae VaMs.102]
MATKPHPSFRASRQPGRCVASRYERLETSVDPGDWPLVCSILGAGASVGGRKENRYSAMAWLSPAGVPPVLLKMLIRRPPCLIRDLVQHPSPSSHRWCRSRCFSISQGVQDARPRKIYTAAAQFAMLLVSRGSLSGHEMPQTFPPPARSTLHHGLAIKMRADQATYRFCCPAGVTQISLGLIEFPIKRASPHSVWLFPGKSIWGLELGTTSTVEGCTWQRNPSNQDDEPLVQIVPPLDGLLHWTDVASFSRDASNDLMIPVRSYLPFQSSCPTVPVNLNDRLSVSVEESWQQGDVGE